MTGKDELIALAERVEALTGPDRQLDRAIHQTVDNRIDPETMYETPTGWRDCETARLIAKTPAFTASLDAAMSLVPEAWVSVHGWDYPNSANRVIFMDDDGDRQFRGRATTPALALTAAALRARKEGP
jgi:hypothetical protein